MAIDPTDIAAKRVSRFKPYPFVKISGIKAEKRAAGIEILDFGIGDPSDAGFSTPEIIVSNGLDAMTRRSYQRYGESVGTDEFRNAIKEITLRDYGMKLEEDQFTALIGSKEGIAHLGSAILDSTDIALHPGGYPVYEVSAILGDAEEYVYPLQDGTFVPLLSDIPENIAKQAKLLWINPQSNPSSKNMSEDDIRDALQFAQDFDLVLASDEAYKKMPYKSERAPSLLDVADIDLDAVIVFDSLSKTYAMTGWRSGWATGNADVIKPLVTIKQNLDSGSSSFIEYASVAALTMSQKHVRYMVDEFGKRRDALIERVEAADLEYVNPDGAFYMLVRVPESIQDVNSKPRSVVYAERLLEEKNIVTTPGDSYGPNFGNYIRFALNQPVEVIEKLDLKLAR